MVMREIRVCDNCGDRFERYHKTVGRFCRSACKTQWHYHENRRILQAVQLADDEVRAKLMDKVAPDLRDWVKATPKTHLSITKRQAIRIVDKYASESRPSFASQEPKLLEDEPNFKPSFISKPEPRLNKPSWQCTQCGDYFHSSPCPNCIDKPKQTDQRDMTLTPDGGIDDDPPY
jgi:predicted  nucleic acid-binding Zn-ribbon protein